MWSQVLATMIRSLQALSAFALLFISGCSGYLKTQHFEVVNDGTLIRFHIHDWYEEESTGPSIGVYRPPVYGFEHVGQWYAIYPVFIRTDTQLIGPPLIPVIPQSDSFGDDPMVLKVRHFSREQAPIAPATISVIGHKATTMQMERGKTDEVGTLYALKLPVSEAEPRFKILLGLSDGSSRTIEFVWRRDRFYSPLFSFNGPTPRPKFERYPE